MAIRKKETSKDEGSKDKSSPKDFEIKPEHPEDLDFKGLESVYATVGGTIIRQANEMIDKLLRALGEDRKNPKVGGVADLFEKVVKTGEKQDLQAGIKTIAKQYPGSQDPLLEAKFTCEKNSHKSQVDYKLNAIQSGTNLETALANWAFAVESYEESAHDAAATFVETVYAARTDRQESSETAVSDIEKTLNHHLNDADYAMTAAQALDWYGKTMEKANWELSSAFATLIADLVQHWNIATASESALMLARHEALQTFWKTVKTTVSPHK